MDESSRQIAAALGAGTATLGAEAAGRRALEDLARSDVDGALARRHRASAALYLHASALGVEGPALPAWRRDMISISAQHLMLGEALGHCAESLSGVAVGWIPLKGIDLATRVYQQVEERVTSDLDLLVASADFERAREALREAGWAGMLPGPRAARYLAEEGYAWQATRKGVLLELHFRLWGSVAEGLAVELIEASTADPELPTGGRRLTPEHAYLVAAVHAWLHPPPRAVTAWRDLECLAASKPSLAEGVVRAACRWGVQLPVLLASEVASRCWPNATCELIAGQLERDLRAPERLALAAARRRGRAATGHGLLTAARLAAGRPTRLRGKIAWRRFWDHPGVVEAATPEGRPWLVRRLAHQLTALGFQQAALRIAGPGDGTPEGEVDS